MVDVTWDPVEDATNRAKHGVSFAEAAELFTSGSDDLEIFDEAHSDEEDRFLAIGPIARGLVLVVMTEPSDHAVRIISARWATEGERALYRAHVGGAS